ncbi:hypothetical protein [Bosea sp. CS1GBMeth4]|uniref:hypothetical protein n=1 Tax=Bosea sp. CS1GBMeth4 TaxID=1892849 RepID=UPI001645DD37|nr:hypothetical protein [Bosea sp. CS1GBMeth4]
MNDYSGGAFDDRASVSPDDVAMNWLNSLPLRWSRNAVLAILVFSAAAALQIGQLTATWLVLLISAACIMAAIAAYLLGYWAVWSLQTRYRNDAAGISRAILTTWISGALLITGFPVILYDLAIQLGFPGEPVGIWRWLMSLPISIAIASVVGLVSRVGLNGAIRSAARTNEA